MSVITEPVEAADARPALSAVSRRAPSVAQWRSTDRDTWTARLGGRAVLGHVVREGIDFVALDDRGASLGRYASLADAESVVGARIPLVASSLERARQRSTAVVAAVAGCLAVAMAIVGLLVLSH